MSDEIAHALIDWRNVKDVRYVVRQNFRYAYPGPIRDLRHRLMISPLEGHGSQRRVRERLRISPEVPIVTGRDAFGNSVVSFCAARINRTLAIEFESTIERMSLEPHRVPRRWLSDPLFLTPTGLTRPDDALRIVALRLKNENRNDLELAAAISSFVFSTMTYTPNATNVHTTASEAFAIRAGVCQDYAHIMIALARACGLPARYISGHLLGEGGTHAWVEVLLPSEHPGEAIAWPFDPTNNRRGSFDYIVVAVGRDYADVAPTSGTFHAPYNGVLVSRKDVKVAMVRYAPQSMSA